MLAVLRWHFTTCALFVLCPRRILVDAAQSDLYNILPSKITAVRWADRLLRDKTSEIAKLEDVEPGFDFTEEEMKRLKIWPTGIIPYYIDEYSFDKVFRDRLRSILDTTNSATGVNFLELHQPPEDEKTRWVFFVNRQGLLACADQPFKNFTSEGVQKVLLGYDCLAPGGELAGIILAIVGVPPQHNAPNRQNYISIVKKNIMPGKDYLFQIIPDNEWLFHDVDYDFSSAGHYPLHKYTMNGMATIQPLNAVDDTIGEGKDFSYTDVWKVRMLYNYISKKQATFVSFPKCNKLFNLGTDFKNYSPNPEDNIEPRKKPNKYWGLSEDIPEQPDVAPNYIDAKDTTENGTEVTEETTIISDSDNKEFDNSEQSPNNESNDNDKQKTRSVHEKLYGNNAHALFEFSDYGTDDENKKKYKHNRHFTKPGRK